jgi:hypothetical protein
LLAKSKICSLKNLIDFIEVFRRNLKQKTKPNFDHAGITKKEKFENLFLVGK